MNVSIESRPVHSAKTERKKLENMSTAANDPASSNKDDSMAVRWEDVKKARNRINSQRTRERERAQMESLEAERERLWLSNDAIRFQNGHFRQAIHQVRELQRVRASSALGSGGLGGRQISAPTPSAAELHPSASALHQLQGHELGRLAVGLPLAPTPSTGSSGLVSDSLLAQHQAALDAQALLHRQRAGLGGLGSFHTMSHPRAISGQPTYLNHALTNFSSAGSLASRALPLDLIELRAHQPRLHGLSADMPLNIPRAVQAPASMNDSGNSRTRSSPDDSKQDPANRRSKKRQKFES